VIVDKCVAVVPVIAIDQDPLMYGGDRVALTHTGGQIWSKDLYNGDKAVVLYNNGTGDINIAVTWPVLGWPINSNVLIRDLWNRTDVGVFASGYNTTVGTHDVFFFRATLQQ
jgi:alpha-galactosidase